MPRVFWKRKSDDSFLNDPHSAPIGKNVLTLTNVDQTENYTCHAVSRLGDIEASTTVEVKALPPSPKNLKISEVMPSSVRLTWDPLRLDSEPVKKYLVRYRQKNSLNGKDDASSSPAVSSPAYAESGAYREKEVPVVSNSLLIANLEPYTQYEFSILAISSIGRGTLSNPVETQTGEIAPTTAPRKIQARALNRNSILVRWDPPDKPNGQITDYKVFYTNEEQNTPHPLWKTKETKADEQMTTLYNLVAESTYYIQVQARNAQGSGPMSKTATVITKHGIPGQPSGLKARALDSKRIELSWEKPLHSFNIVGYTVRYNTSRESDRELTLTSPVEKVVIDRLDPDTFYSFKVAAKSTRGIGAFCEDVVAKTQQSVPSAPPVIKNLTTVSSTSLLLEWEAPEEFARNGVLTEYLIRWWPASSAKPTSKAYPLDFESDEWEVFPEPSAKRFVVKGSREVRKAANETTNLIIERLEPYTIYEVTIAAGTEKGFGPPSGREQQRTGEDGRCSRRLEFRINSIIVVGVRVFVCATRPVPFLIYIQLSTNSACFPRFSRLPPRPR
ncbi:hypothetical protein L596_002427 [Steinernema carpocapsae]|uniref:Uncharacterized protein n=1 Tax=Steinernema carpocapsae TaxID=34508 RepID=A0A4U8UPH1_STECR|nr:hypothetical protein L596_002427 [Steinernema carpocapsae]